MKMLLIFAMAFPVFGQWTNFQTAAPLSPNLYNAMNSKPAIQEASGVPSSNCTAGKDFYIDSGDDRKLLYWCDATNHWTAGISQDSTAYVFLGFAGQEGEVDVGAAFGGPSSGMFAMNSGADLAFYSNNGMDVEWLTDPFMIAPDGAAMYWFAHSEYFYPDGAAGGDVQVKTELNSNYGSTGRIQTAVISGAVVDTSTFYFDAEFRTAAINYNAASVELATDGLGCEGKYDNTSTFDPSATGCYMFDYLHNRGVWSYGYGSNGNGGTDNVFAFAPGVTVYINGGTGGGLTIDSGGTFEMDGTSFKFAGKTCSIVGGAIACS